MQVSQEPSKIVWYYYLLKNFPQFVVIPTVKGYDIVNEPDVQAGFRKGRGIRDKIANICWMIEKAREFQKNI